MLATLVLLLASLVAAVKKEDFRRCDQSGFCSRHHGRMAATFAAGQPSAWTVDAAAVRVGPEGATFPLTDGRTRLQAALTFLQDARTIRLQIDEEQRGVRRYTIPAGDVVSEDLVVNRAGWAEELPRAADRLRFVADGASVALHLAPFRLLVHDGAEVVLDMNGSGLFHVESEALPAPSSTAPAAGEASASEGDAPPAPDTDRQFGKHRDSMARGRQSLSCDFGFGGSPQLYGLAEHTAGLALRTTARVVPWAGSHNVTRLDEPYRLYNLDVFEYELDSTMALYGAVPFVLSRSAGLLWNNPSETWVDVVEQEQRPGKAAVFTSESGVLDLFVLLGPPKEALLRMAQVTGFPVLPPQFALGYHQCRWNYRTQAELLEVHADFDAHDMPVDVLWLDIEHTDGKRYFTWDAKLFPAPEAMQQTLAAHGRHLVTIVDPHIKTDPGYGVYAELLEKRLAVLGADRAPFKGHCWPGESAWPDFACPRVRAWWAGRFAYAQYPGSTANLHVWNDMNEPSVFSGPETTMPKDSLHLGGAAEHRDLHNLYGQYMHRATFEGLRQREPAQRPFVLSRAFYAGSQRYGAVWTGDNAAQWSHLAASVPMLLSLAVSGIPFAGADVGGFFGNPDAELLVRWYQTGALYPFFRGHAHLDTKRREPWLVPEPHRAHIRDALRLRYQLLPYLYTLFYEATLSGTPLLRPLFLEFPEDPRLAAVDDQFMLGPALLHKPVTQPGCPALTVALPASQVWYDFFTLQPVRPAAGRHTFEPALGQTPLYLAGGSIVPLKMRPRRSSRAMLRDPFTLVVALDAAGAAAGTAYIDDGSSYDYEQGAAHYQRLAFRDGQLTSAPADSYSLAGPKTLRSDAVSTSIESIVITGFPQALPTSARVVARSPAGEVVKPVTLETDAGRIVRLRLPPVGLGTHWTISFGFD